MFVAEGGNVASTREPDHDWLDEDETGFWWSQEWQSGILIP